MHIGNLFKTRFFLLLFTAFLASFAGCRQESPLPANTGPTVIAAIGDSLTWGALAFGPKADSAGYPVILETLLRQEGYDVVVFNKGIPGEKAYQTHARFERAIADADMALLMIGVNDIIRPESCSEPNNCRTNDHIEAIMRDAAKAGMPLLVSTLTPAQNNCARSWANEPIQAVNARLRTYAEQRNIALADSHQAIIEHGGGALFSDCLHFTDDGYRVLARHWYEAIIEYDLLDASAP